MIELLLNELLSTFPFHFLAYIPFYKKLKYSPLGTFLRVCMCQIFYLGIFTLYNAIFLVILFGLYRFFG